MKRFCDSDLVTLKTKEEQLKDIDKALARLEYRKFLLEDHYRDGLREIKKEIERLMAEKEKINAE